MQNIIMEDIKKEESQQIRLDGVNIFVVWDHKILPRERIIIAELDLNIGVVTLPEGFLSFVLPTALDVIQV